MLSRRDTGYWEGMASGAAVLTTSYGSPDREQILPSLAAAQAQVYGSSSVVSAAVLTRMMLFSEARLQFQSVSDKKLFGDQRLRVLEEPWPDGHTGELLARMEQDASIAGTAYIWDAGDQLVRWRPDWVTIVSRVTAGPRGAYREVVGYHFEPPKGQQAQYGRPQDAPVAEVVHW